MVYEHALDVVISEGNSVQHTFWQWYVTQDMSIMYPSLLRRVCVDRSACKKGCIGPVLRPIQRFGRVGKRSGPEAPKNQAGQLKNYKYMYLSMDEAGTHVGGSRFRLIFCVYDESGSTMLGTTVSVPIRVLANNDVPTGAAHVPINITLRCVVSNACCNVFHTACTQVRLGGVVLPFPDAQPQQPCTPRHGTG